MRLCFAKGDEPAFVLERERSGGRDGLDEQRILFERAVVDEGRHRPSLTLDHRSQLFPAPVGEVDRAPVQVGEGLGLGDPVRQAQRRVAERPCQRFSQLAGRMGLAQLEHEMADSPAGEPTAQEPDDEGERDGCEGEGDDPGEDAPAAFGEGADDEPDPQEDERRPRGEVDGKEEPPEQRRRRDPPAPEDVQGGQERRDPCRDEDGVDRSRGGGRVDDQEGVRRAFGAIAGDVGEDRGEEGADCERQVRNRDDGIDDPRLQ
jgi:hypothetical protein